MAGVKAMYVRFSKGNFRKTGALSALKCGFFTFKFDVQLNLDYPDLLGPHEIVRIIEGPDNRKYEY